MYDVRCTMYHVTKYNRKEPHSAALFVLSLFSFRVVFPLIYLDWR